MEASPKGEVRGAQGSSFAAAARTSLQRVRRPEGLGNGAAFSVCSDTGFHTPPGGFSDCMDACGLHSKA